MLIKRPFTLTLFWMLAFLAALPGYATAEKSETRTFLAACCDSLLEKQNSDGIFDSQNAPWWEAGIATRALLAGYQILGDHRYLDAAKLTVDKFLSEQNYDGGWCSYALETVIPSRRNSFNTADVGCMLVCLPLAAPYLSPDQAARCLEAHENYIQHFLPRHDLASGAFCNGWFKGDNYQFPYSIATATQSQSFLSLYQMTGKEAYRRRAEAAIRFLLENWRDNGTFTLHQYDKKRTKTLPATGFQNIYYILEAILWFYNVDSEEACHETIRTHLLNYLWGEAGLIEQIRDRDWIETIPRPDRAKALGMIGILSGLGRILGPVAGVDGLIEQEVAKQGAMLATDKIATTAEFAFFALSLAQLTDPQIGVMGER